jgi:hypothetical protein
MKQAMIWINMILILSCLSFAQSQDTSSSMNKKFQEHPWTIEFGVTSYFTLTSFQGSIISVGKYISDHEKLRLGISASINYQKMDDENNYTYSDSINGGTINGSMSHVNESSNGTIRLT